MSPNLLDLPVELINLIAAHSDHPCDLLAFITTCKYVNHVFRDSKTSVLLAIVKNKLGHELLCDAVTACQASRTTPLSTTMPPPTKWDEHRQRLVEEYSKPYAARTLDLRELTLLNQIYKLWSLSEGFLALFTDRAFSEMPLVSSGPGPELPISPPLSTIERNRLLRGFFRFEIYRRLTTSTYAPSDDQATNPVPGAAVASVAGFLNQFSTWEQEEMFSIQNFLVDHVTAMQRELHFEVASKIAEVAERGLVSVKEKPQLSRRTAVLELVVAYYTLQPDEYYHDTRTRFRSFRPRAQYLAARGLPFIRWLSSLPATDRLRIVFRHSCPRYEPSLTEENLIRNDWPDYSTTDAPIPADSLASPNTAWAWVQENIHRSGGIHMALRRFGYVFWDENRLKQCWNFPEISTLDLALVARDFDLRRAHRDRELKREPVRPWADPESLGEILPGSPCYKAVKMLNPGDNSTISRLFPLGVHPTNAITMKYDFEY